MSAGARTVAMVAVVAALALSVTTAPASAGVAGTVCGVAGLLSGVAGKLCTVATHAGRVLDAGKRLAGGHVGGAHYALKLTATAIGGSTNPDVGGVWFSSSYWRMAAVAALLTVPFLCAAAVQAMLHSDLTLLTRSAFGYLPFGLLAVGVAAPLTALLLAGSDEMSTIVSSASGHAGATFLDRVGALGGAVSVLSGSAFVSFFIALFTIAAAITLWLELLIRQAAVYVIVLMLPLFFAAMVWPARRIWAVRAVELLVALILSKFAIVAVLGLGAAALGHTLLPGIGTLLAGTTLVLLAAFSPWAMLRLLPLHELAGAALGGLRPHAAQPAQMAHGRAEGTTDAAEDAAGGGDRTAANGGAVGADAASEDVAAGLPARLRALTQRAMTGGEGRSQGAEQGALAGTGEPAAADTTPPSPPGATNAKRHAGSTPGGADAATTEMPLPETDVFGPTARHGDLPAVFQNMSLDADVLQLGPPPVNGADGRPDAGLPTLPDVPASGEPEDEPQ